MELRGLADKADGASALPPIDGEPPQMFAGNARTGAWGLFTGWDGRCLQLFGERLFFGSGAGKIIEAEVSGSDNGMPYTSVCVPLFDPLKTPASLKTSLLIARHIARAVRNCADAITTG